MKTFTHPEIELRCNCTHAWHNDRENRLVYTLDQDTRKSILECREGTDLGLLYEYYSANINHPLRNYCAICGLYKWEIIK
jgi:hypothetical protein